MAQRADVSTAGGAAGGPRSPQPGAAAGALPFEVLAEIAVGATARVDLCRVLTPHSRSGQLLAVKRLHPHIAEDPTFANQFFDEAWMTASLKHPNVVEVAGWGADDQGTYLAVELVQGVSLIRLMKTIFDTGEAFTERMVVYLASGIGRGLAAAHALRAPNGELLNLVHRDLTPANVLLGFNGEVKIADFGLAKAKQRLTKTLTGMRKGEPTYMAPEQAKDDAIDARADLFSFGVLLFELFSGRRPWIAKSDFEMVQITTREPPADLQKLRPKIDRELVSIVNRCLEKAPAARFQSASEIVARFDEWLSVHGYQEGNDEALGRFVRRNSMRQMRWFERAIAGEMSPKKVGRELPRVPTYTDGSDQPVRRTEPPPAPVAGAQVGRKPGSVPPPVRPAAPARPQAADPRSIRAANAVQQLKKLAPAMEPPRLRARSRPPPLEDPDGDATDVELRVAALQQQGPPRITDVDDEETGEEQPTLVHKGDAKLQAMRAEARKAAGQRGKPPYVSPGRIADEDSDERITAVKKEEQRRAARSAPGIASIVDPDSELPTEPRNSKQPLVEPPEAPTPAIPLRAKASPSRLVIPPSPDIPQRPFPGFEGGKPGAKTQPLPPAPATEAGPPLAFDPARVSQHDDVVVLDRNALRQQSMLSEDGIIAEADRLAIEAVRCGEEARSAQLRAERKVAAAKLAGEAAMIAADAVRMVRSVGIAAAVKRLDEARAVEASQSLQSGKIPTGQPERTSSQIAMAPGLRPGPGVDSQPPSEPSRAPSVFPGDPGRPVFISSAPPAVPAGPAMMPRPGEPGGFVFPSGQGGGPRPPMPTAAPLSQPPPPQDSRPSYAPTALFEAGSGATPGNPYAISPAGADLDAFRPKIFGLPSAVVVGIAVAVVFLVIVLALLLAR